MQLAGVLHDIGKIGVADAIVNKPGPLTPEEWDEMQKHPEFGARMLERAELWDIAEWVLAHHERPDGKGYPLRADAATRSRSRRGSSRWPTPTRR